MAGPTVTLAFAGDSARLEKTFTNVGTGAKRMASDFDKAEAKTKSFGSSVDNMNDKVGDSESKFMGTADLLDGLGGAFGLPLEGATNMARSFADLAGGLSSVVGPAIGKVAAMFGIQTAATTAQTTATGAATTAQWSLNAAFAANPIGVVVIAVAALTAAFVLAWKNSETFRSVVTGAFNAVKTAALGVWEFIRDLPGKLLGIGGAITDAVTAPFRGAFNAIARLWNSTIGGFGIPSFGVGPFKTPGFTIPKMPTFHQGGVMGGPSGQPGLAVLLGGERVLSPAQSAAAPQTIILQVDGRELARIVTDQQRGNAARGFR